MISFLTESPRWLISKGRDAAAYRIIFNKKCDMEFAEKAASKAKEAEQEVLKTIFSLLLFDFYYHVSSIELLLLFVIFF